VAGELQRCFSVDLTVLPSICYHRRHYTTRNTQSICYFYAHTQTFAVCLYVFLETHGVDTLGVDGSHDAIVNTIMPPSKVVEHDFSRGPYWPGKVSAGKSQAPCTFQMLLEKNVRLPFCTPLHHLHPLGNTCRLSIDSH
jgi:hypothetical protein